MINSMTGRRLPRRLVQLYLGLALYGVSIAALVLADLGLMPWNVLHQGLARQLGWSLGTVIIVVGVLVLLAWIPLRERPGIGTVSNVVVVGLVADAVIAVVDAPSSLAGPDRPGRGRHRVQRRRHRRLRGRPARARARGTG